MDKELLAANYVESNQIILIDSLKQAYLQGYNQALIDTQISINIDGVEYVDMGLPSGTLWSKEPLMSGKDYRRFNYADAFNLPIPTIEQWKELCESCSFLGDQMVAQSPNCQRIRFNSSELTVRGEECDFKLGEFKFWLKGDSNTVRLAPSIVYIIKNPKYHNMRYDEFKFNDYPTPLSHKIGDGKHFSGYKLPVFLVKNKSNIR